MAAARSKTRARAAGGQARRAGSAASRRRAHAGQLLVQERVGPLGQLESTADENGTILLVTPPVEVITTTITTCGWSISTSTCRIVVVSSGGAETSATSDVTCDLASRWSCAGAVSTSLRTVREVDRQRIDRAERLL